MLRRAFADHMPEAAVLPLPPVPLPPRALDTHARVVGGVRIQDGNWSHASGIRRLSVLCGNPLHGE
eukprot:10662305-Alexandrium_andersonii.AAC.1